ncbi:MAG: tetratricopeptide repeat protein [Kofleriaceae bacterium]|nr:tetratricopeptide repeat protein [Kofleriaceae bacterium]
MAKKRRDEEASGGLDRVLERLDDAPAGLHDVEPPASELPRGLPEPLIELYARCNGLRLFLDSLEIVPQQEVTMPTPGKWQFATHEGDAIAMDHKGKIWRTDESLDDDVCDGTRLDRWLAGVLDATGLLYDGDGEFAEDVFDEDGDVLPTVREQQLRAHLKRDAAAPGIRWKLGLALLDQGAVEDARNELEQVVADDPAFTWAWLDLARISERLGEVGNAVDEIRMAAQTAEGTQHPQAGYFWAQLARLAIRSGDDVLRAQAATKTSLLAPTLKRAQLDGARDSLEAGDVASAKGLLELLRAVWPRDLEVLELAKRVETSAS